MKTYIVIYEGFSQFEVIIASFLLRTKGDVITVGLTADTVTTAEGFVIKPDVVLSEMRRDDVDFFLIPGGPPNELMASSELSDILNELNEQKTFIGGICSGTLHLASSGILENKRYTTSLDLDEFDVFNKERYTNENVVSEGNIITAKGCAYVEFGILLGQLGDVYVDETDLKETIDYFKHSIE